MPLKSRFIITMLLTIWLLGTISFAQAQSEGASAGRAQIDSASASNTPGIQAATQDSIIVDAQGRVVVPPASDLAMKRYRSGNVLWVVDLLLGFLIPLVILFTGFSAWMRDTARKIGKKWFFLVAIYFILYTLVEYIIGFPLSYYEGFVREHAYGLSNQAFGKWFGDSIKELIIGLVVGALVIWLPYLLLKKAPKRWWLYTGIGAIPFIFFFLMISPIWIAPLFNDYGPMKDKALETKILNLADRAGIEGARVFEVNKSVDTKTVNAYVTGFAGSKRIVLWDTILQKLNPDEVLFVMGHEMAHYVMHHIIKTIFLTSLLIMAGLWVVHRTSGYFITRYQNRFGFDHLGDIASLPLLSVLFSLVMLFTTPVMNVYSRYLEHESDRFGLEITQNNFAGATAFVKLQSENLGNPRPGWFYKLMRSDHPPIGERVDFMNSYHPWKSGQPLKYGKLFKPISVAGSNTTQ
ncbi:MAG: M48 family metallopeptidase [bacterium]|nr:M48 family metallopeptidase [bacterium]